MGLSIAATGIKITYDTALSAPAKPRYVPSAKDDRRPAQERINAEMETEAISLALQQPHRGGHAITEEEARRAGSRSARLGEPLGRFCAAQHGPSRAPLGDHCWDAGQRYAEIVRDAKNAAGFPVHGWQPSDNMAFSLTPAQIDARKELAQARKRDADQILSGIKLRLPAVLEKLCYDQLEPYACDEGIIVAGLVALAIEWNMIGRKFGA